ncbi:hypothetical protein [Ruminococcus sp.]|uniref:hypothetical protein n=1 Tax=Ruminococcus sp. TaxID=41978 RepID=UPI0025D66FC4|nr:hypothetical protein [Ruminococcus sp.]
MEKQFSLCQGVSVEGADKLRSCWCGNGENISGILSCELIAKTASAFIEKLGEPIFFFLELSEGEGFKTYYLDNCTKEVALAIMKRYGALLVNDGTSRFGFGSHKNDEEIYFTDYQEFQIYSPNPQKIAKIFSRLGVEKVQEDDIVTMWDLIREDNVGCLSCVEADGETVADIVENLKPEGMYEAE